MRRRVFVSLLSLSLLLLLVSMTRGVHVDEHRQQLLQHERRPPPTNDDNNSSRNNANANTNANNNNANNNNNNNNNNNSNNNSNNDNISADADTDGARGASSTTMTQPSSTAAGVAVDEVPSNKYNPQEEVHLTRIGSDVTVLVDRNTQPADNGRWTSLLSASEPLPDIFVLSGSLRAFNATCFFYLKGNGLPRADNYDMLMNTTDNVALAPTHLAGYVENHTFPAYFISVTMTARREHEPASCVMHVRLRGECKQDCQSVSGGSCNEMTGTCDCPSELYGRWCQFEWQRHCLSRRTDLLISSISSFALAVSLTAVVLGSVYRWKLKRRGGVDRVRLTH